MLRLSALIGVFAAGGIALAFGDGGKIEWQKAADVDAAIKEAKKSNTIVMAYWTAGWCGYCKQQNDAAFSDEAIVRRSQSVVRVLIDCTEKATYEAQKKKWGFMGVPAVYFIDGDGKILDKVIGVLSAEGFLKRFDKFVPAVGVAPTAHLQDEAAKRIQDRIQKELDEAAKRLREDIGRIVKSELEKSGVTKTVQPKEQPKKALDVQVKELLPKLSDEGLTGKLKKFLATKEGLDFVKQTLEQGGLDSVEAAIEQYFEKDAKGKLVVRAEFESQLESMLGGGEPKEQPKEQPKKPAYLGISADDFTDDERADLGLAAGAGVRIFEVRAGSPAEKAGLKPGDVIIQIGGAKVTDKNMSEVVGKHGAGDTAEFTVLRGKDKKTLKVTFAERK
jgi:thiol-disulfide isomerase/thioredoxin